MQETRQISRDAAAPILIFTPSTLFHLQLSAFKLDDEHKGTISQKLEEAQEVKFTLGRPKAALQKVQQRVQVERRPAEALETVLHNLTAPPTATSRSDSDRVGAGLPPRPPVEDTASFPVLSSNRGAACNSPTQRVRPPSRGEFREYGPGEYNAMIARRARSFEREGGEGYRSGSLGLRRRDASWDRKWRDEQDRNRCVPHLHDGAALGPRQGGDPATTAFTADLRTFPASATAGFLAR